MGLRERSRRKLSGGAAGAFAVLDEVFYPSALQASIIREHSREVGAPMPSPEDEPFSNGKIRVSVPESAEPAA